MLGITVTLALALLGHLVAVVRFGTQLRAEVTSGSKAIVRIEEDLRSLKGEFTKVFVLQSEISALKERAEAGDRRIALLEERLIRLMETRNHGG